MSTIADLLNNFIKLMLFSFLFSITSCGGGSDTGGSSTGDFFFVEDDPEPINPLLSISESHFNPMIRWIFIDHVTDSKIEVDWLVVSGATYYKLYRSG